MAALARLQERAQALGSCEPEHYVFPARSELSIPHVLRRVGVRRGESSYEKQPGASAEKALNRRSNPVKVSVAPPTPH
jgi:hypothetical protein